MTLLKDNNYKDINIALLSLESDIKKLSNFDTSAIDKQLADINERIDEINAGSNSSGSSGDNSAEINDLRAEIEDIDARVSDNSAEIADINTKLSSIFSAENFVGDFNTAIEPGVYYWTTNSQNRPNNYGVLLVNRLDDGENSNWINQTAYSTSGLIYFRQKVNDNEWRDWKTIAFEDITKTYTIPDVSTVTARYIKLGTFPWHFAETVKVYLSGNNFADTVEFNILGGNATNASVNGWYTTNGGKTTGIYVKPVEPVSFASNIEVWLRVEQYTTLQVKLTGNAKAAQYFNTNPQMNYTTTAPTGAKAAAYFNMKRGYFGYNENTLNCYNNNSMVGLGFTKDQVVSVSEFAQALINYTGTIRGQVHFMWLDAERAYIKATTPYNTQLEINGGTIIFHSRNKNVSEAWNTFEAQYVNRAGELFTFGILKDTSTVTEYVRKEVDTSGKVATAGTADTANTAKGWQEYTLNLKSLSNSNFYPVVIDTGYKFVDVEICSENGSAGLPYNQNRIKFTISAAGWSDTPQSLFISEYDRYDANEVTIGCIGYCTEDALKAVIWLRGGLYYTCYTMNCSSAPSVKTVDTTLGNSTVTVGTSYSGGTNTKVGILFTPDTTMSKGIYSSGGMTTAGNLKVQNTIGAANLIGYGKEPLSIGVASDLNVGLDKNSIQARSGSVASGLYLNHYGGRVYVNNTKSSSGGLTVDGNTTLRNNITASLANYGKDPLSIGEATGANLGIDGDDIQARNNGAAGRLDLNYYGGPVFVNAQGLANGGLTVGGRLNIPTSAPSSPQKGDIWLVL